MGFIEAYKRLEKLCGEVLNNERRVSAYIDEMINNPSGSRYVAGWDEVLKQLRHYRWVRNQIVHEPDCTEDNMCEPDDAEWLESFHLRIMSASDPLSMYRKARNPQVTQKPKQTHSNKFTHPEYKKATSKPAGCLTYVMGVLLVVAVVVLIVATI